MDSRTGEIAEGENIKSIAEKFGITKINEMEAFIKEVSESDMTQKQKSEKMVSKFDTRSKLGIYRRKLIAEIGRNNPCPCGSGEKFKKCCLR